MQHQFKIQNHSPLPLCVSVSLRELFPPLKKRVSRKGKKRKKDEKLCFLWTCNLVGFLVSFIDRELHY